ncbi:MAG: GLUG motif-containing protein, partial [Candidatus Marinimicrobia bacterium]|nr:GLUG motif-containing protein [Candidatus Neomarinimicrobiota bacterium]
MDNQINPSEIKEELHGVNLSEIKEELHGVNLSEIKEEFHGVKEKKMKNTNLVLGIMLIMLLALSTGLMAQTTATAPDGSGTSGDPYLISNLAELSYVCQNLGDTDYWASGVYLKQDSDIDATQTQYWDDADDDSDGDLYNDTNDGSNTGNDEGFSPIGSSSSAKFYGSYDGAGHTIDNLYINRSGTNYIGLFGWTNGTAMISNLGVTHVDITGNHHVGGLVGENKSSTVENSYSTGSVSGSGYYVGGLVGENYSSTVSNSYSTGSVSGSSNVGGLVGKNYLSTVSNSYSTGSVSGNSNYVGGLVGINTKTDHSSTITNSYSTGSVSGSSNVGGLVGGNNATVSNSFWDTETSGQSSSEGGTGKTTDEMKTENFSGWGWTSTWERIGYNYPRLIDNPDQSLPVEFTSFTAENKSSGVLLKWSTGSEIENVGFILERRDLKIEIGNWEKIASYITHKDLQGQGSVSCGTEY